MSTESEVESSFEETSPELRKPIPKGDINNILKENEIRERALQKEKAKKVRQIRRYLKTHKNLKIQKKSNEQDELFDKSIEELNDILEDFKVELYSKGDFPIAGSMIRLSSPVLEKKFEMIGLGDQLAQNTALQLKVEEFVETYIPEKLKFIQEYIEIAYDIFKSVVDSKERFRKRKREEEEYENSKKQRTESEKNNQEP